MVEYMEKFDSINFEVKYLSRKIFWFIEQMIASLDLTLVNLSKKGIKLRCFNNKD